MTATLVVLYTTPDNPADFDAHYRDVHLPIVRRWPGVEAVELTRVDATMGRGESDYYLITRIRFADRAALDEALGSPAGREAGKDYAAIAPTGSFMLIGHSEDGNSDV